MVAIGLKDILATPLKRISTEGGDVMLALNKSDKGFNGFGEVYFSWVEQGSIKAWKCHQRMTLNLVVPLGEVYFVFELERNGRAVSGFVFFAAPDFFACGFVERASEGGFDDDHFAEHQR